MQARQIQPKTEYQKIPSHHFGMRPPEEFRGLSPDELAKHGHMTPEEARSVLLNVVNSIPDDELTDMVGAQITLVV